MVAAVKASVIQGSGLGPVSFIVTAADLHPTTPGNRIFKFADYTYLVVPATNSSSRLNEVSHVEAWASRNNLRLNRTKFKELIFIRDKCGQSKSSHPPPPCPNIERVSCTKVLGITLSDRLSATDHVNNFLTSCSSLLYVMRVLRGHGISTESLHDVFRATILAKITYCLPAWSGLCSDRTKLDSFLNRCKHLGFCDNTVPVVDFCLFQPRNVWYVEFAECLH